MEKVKIKKRDGNWESFDFAKIEKVVIASGLAHDKAKKLSKQVADWVKQENKNELSSLEIRDRIIIELEKMDLNAAGLYKWYQKTKDE